MGNSKRLLKAKDIAEMMGCSMDSAYGIIRAIKLVSDRTGLSGRVTQSDFDEWYNIKESKGKIDFSMSLVIGIVQALSKEQLEKVLKPMGYKLVNLWD